MTKNWTLSCYTRILHSAILALALTGPVSAQAIIVEPTAAGDALVFGGDSVRRFRGGEGVPVEVQETIAGADLFCLSPSESTVTIAAARGKAQVFFIATGKPVKQHGLEKVGLCAVQRVGSQMVAVGFRAVGEVMPIHNVLLGVEAVVLMANQDGSLWTELAVLGENNVVVGMCAIDERTLVAICSNSTVARLSIDFAKSQAAVRILHSRASGSSPSDLALYLKRESSINVTTDALGILGVWGGRAGKELGLLSLDMGCTWTNVGATRLAEANIAQPADLFPRRQAIVGSGDRISQVGPRLLLFRDAITDFTVELPREIVTWSASLRGDVCAILDSRELIMVTRDGRTRSMGNL